MVENSNYSGVGSFAAGLSYSEMADDYFRRQSWRFRFGKWWESLREGLRTDTDDGLGDQKQFESGTAGLVRNKKLE